MGGEAVRCHLGGGGGGSPPSSRRAGRQVPLEGPVAQEELHDVPARGQPGLRWLGVLAGGTNPPPPAPHTQHTVWRLSSAATVPPNSPKMLNESISGAAMRVW